MFKPQWSESTSKISYGTSKLFPDENPVSSASVDFNVIVLGSGISGLTAAYFITEKDPSLNVIVLEARGSIGGRIMTVPMTVSVDGQTDNFDFGGQWIHPSQSHIMDLLKKLNIKTYPQLSNGSTVGQAGDPSVQIFKSDFLIFGPLFTQYELNRFVRKIECLSKGVVLIDPCMKYVSKEYDGMTVETLITENLYSESARNIVRTYVRNTFGAESTQISALFFIAYATAANGFKNQFKTCGLGTKCLRIEGGAGSIISELSERIGKNCIITNSPVTEVEQFADKAVLKTASGQEYRCQFLIIAIPPSELDKISFKPSLPVLHSYISRSLIPGHCISFVATYDKPFWRQQGLSGEVFSYGGRKIIHGCDTGPISCVFDATTQRNHAALVGFSCGKNSIQWSCKSPLLRKEMILNALCELLSNDLAFLPIDYKEVNWATEDYLGGGPTYAVSPGVMHWLYNIRFPYGRIHWAGAETAVLWYGHLNGAVEAGIRAAVEVLYELRPQVLTVQDVAGVRRRPARSEPAPYMSHVYRWTVLLPLVIIGVGWVAYNMRTKYGYVGTGRII